MSKGKNFTHRLISIDDKPVWLPRITYVLDKVIDKGPGFRKWLQWNGKEADEIANDAAEEGSKVHKVSEILFEQGKVNLKDVYYEVDGIPHKGLTEESEVKKVIGFKNCILENNWKYYSTELMVHDGKCSGQLDIIAIAKDQDVYHLSDIKCGKNIYESHKIQLMFYLKCLKSIHPDWTIIPHLLHLKDNTKKGFQLIDFTDNEINDYTRGYEEVYDLYKILGFPMEPSPEYEIPEEINLLE
ncbi:MAG: Dna2/Cas4 domain-containing protein [Smithella sp.]